MRQRTTILVGLVLSSSIARPQSETWNRLNSANAPSPRSGSVIVHDTARNRLVLVGGFDANRVLLSDVWEWDGTNWTLRPAVTSPPGRGDFALAYDPTRMRVVLFGGTNAQLFAMNDTWEWDGNNWTRLQPAVTPPARGQHRMVFDGVRGTVLLFGGVSFLGGGATYYGDTWEWNGTTWSQLLAAPAPPSRAEHAMVYDPVGRHVLLHGGVNGSTGRGDTWRWNGTSWFEIRSATPWFLHGHHLLVDPQRDGVFLISDVLTMGHWTGSAWVQHTDGFANVPSGRAHFAAAYDPHARRILIIGGYLTVGGAPLTNETWQLRRVLEGTPDHIVGTAGGTHFLDVDFGTQSANQTYVILGSMSGTTPGTRVFNAVLPLNLDVYTDLTFSLGNSATFMAFRGQFDGSGHARALLTLPPIPGFAGPLPLHHAVLALNNSGGFYTSGPAAVELR